MASLPEARLKKTSPQPFRCPGHRRWQEATATFCAGILAECEALSGVAVLQECFVALSLPARVCTTRGSGVCHSKVDKRYDLQFRHDDTSSSVPAFVAALFPWPQFPSREVWQACPSPGLAKWQAMSDPGSDDRLGRPGSGDTESAQPADERYPGPMAYAGLGMLNAVCLLWGAHSDGWWTVRSGPCRCSCSWAWLAVPPGRVGDQGRAAAVQPLGLRRHLPRRQRSLGQYNWARRNWPGSTVSGLRCRA